MRFLDCLCQKEYIQPNQTCNKVNITVTVNGCLDRAAWSSSSHLTSSPGENYWQFCFMLKILWLTELLVTRLKLSQQRKRTTEERAEDSNMNGAQLESVAAGERSPGWGSLTRQAQRCATHSTRNTCTICPTGCTDEFSLQSPLRENDGDYLKVLPSWMSMPGPRTSALKPPEELGLRGGPWTHGH